MLVKKLNIWLTQGARTFVGGKNGHENFGQARIYNFCDKCVVFARNRKFANLTPVPPHNFCHPGT